MRRQTCSPRSASPGIRRRMRSRRTEVPSCRSSSRKPVVLRLLPLDKLRELEELVPGGSNLGVEALLRKTAEYISLLELKVVLMKCISDLYGD